MTTEATNRKSVAYQMVVTATGLGLWLTALAAVFINYAWPDQLRLLAFVPLIIVVGMFVQHFRLPVGLKFTKERITFTFADAMILLVAGWLGPTPAIVLAGIEGCTSSLRKTRRLSSILFSSSIMSLGAGAASAALIAVLHYGFSESFGIGPGHTFTETSIALLAAGIVQIAANIVLLSTLLALRHDRSVVSHWRDFLWTVPMFLPNSAAATLLYLAVQHDLVTIIIIALPVFFAIFFGQRQYRDSVQKRIMIMEKGHRETIEALAVAINAKDEVTHEHVLRVQIYSAGVAGILGCSDTEIEALRAGALLHDIGKIAVPDFILNKPGKLTAAEFEKMKFHTIAGAQILSRVEFPYPIVPVVRHHHERWDGGGYPDGLSGEQIPLTARILSVVDCFDAVREDRQYRKGMTREQAIELIRKGSGTQYDPNVVETFIRHLSIFEAEIQAQRSVPVPTFGIEPGEELTEAARGVAPAAGLAEEEAAPQSEADLSNLELRMLYNLSRVISSAETIADIIEMFTEKLRAMVPFDLAAVTMVSQETGENVVVHATGQHSAYLKGRKIMPGEGVTGWVIANGKPFSNTDPKLDLPTALIEQGATYRTLAIFPIIRGGELHGAVSLYSSVISEYTPGSQRIINEAVMLLATALAAASSKMKQGFAPLLMNDAGSKRSLRASESGSLSLEDVLPESELAQ